MSIDVTLDADLSLRLVAHSAGVCQLHCVYSRGGALSCVTVPALFCSPNASCKRNHMVLLSQTWHALQLHITKNYMAEKGCFASKIKVPLIMGIWGPKGQGKSFQAELVFRKMG